MAGTPVLVRETAMPDSDVYELRRSYNLLVVSHDALVTKINAILTAAATNIAAIAAVPVATATTAYVIKDMDGGST